MQLLLGGDNGLRGYPLRYESGTSRALFTDRAARFHRLVSVSAGAGRRRRFRRCRPDLGQRRRRQQRSGLAARRGFRPTAGQYPPAASAMYCISTSRFRSTISPGFKDSNSWCRRCRASSAGRRSQRPAPTCGGRDISHRNPMHTAKLSTHQPSCRALFLSSGCAGAAAICKRALEALARRRPCVT